MRNVCKPPYYRWRRYFHKVTDKQRTYSFISDPENELPINKVLDIFKDHRTINQAVSVSNLDRKSVIKTLEYLQKSLRILLVGFFRCPLTGKNSAFYFTTGLRKGQV